MPKEIAVRPAPGQIVITNLAAFTSSWSAVKVAGVNVCDAFLIAALALTLVSSLNGPGIRALEGWMVLPAAVAFTLLVRDAVIFNRPLSMVPSSDSGIPPSQLMARILLSTLVVCVILAATYATGGARSLRIIQWYWVAGILVSCLVAAMQSAGTLPYSIQLIQTISTSSNRYPGLSGHPNSLAQAAVLAMPVLAYALLRAQRPVFRIAALIAVAVTIRAVFISGSRAGLVIGFVVIAASLVWILWNSRARKYVPSAVLFAFLVSLLYLPNVVARTRLSATSGANLSDRGRLGALESGFELFTNAPFWGAGLGMWVGESVPVILLSSGGLVLFGAFLWFLIRPTAAFWNDRRHLTAQSSLIFCFAIFGFGMLNNGLFERYTFWPLIAAFLITAGSLEGRAARRRSARKQRIRAHSRVR